MSLSDALTEPPPEPNRPDRPGTKHPTGLQYEWDGTKGHIETGPLKDRPRTWDEFIRDAGLDPNEVEVIEPVQVRGWDGVKGGGAVVRMHYYRLTVQRIRPAIANLDDLVKAAKRRTRKAPPVPATEDDGEQYDTAYLIALGDMQLGKADGDGVEGTVGRFLDKTRAAIERYRRVAKGSPIYLAHLGDCIEGFQSQGGANAWRTTLTTTEQVRLYRRLIIEQVKALAPITPNLVVCGIPGNHDEAHRPLHTYGDSWAIDSMAAVRDALDLAGGYDHVTIHTPARDELTLTIDMAGTVVTMAHGHQFGTGVDGWKKWWQGQAHGRQAPGDADILLGAHKHHLVVVQQGPRTFIQTPALESESTWWRHRTGEGGAPGIVTALVGGGSWSSMEVL